MVTLSFEEVQNNLAGAIGRVRAGETVIITQSDQPVAELSPVTQTDPDLRPFGLCKGQFSVPEDFDEPLPDDVLREFESV